MVNYQTAVLDRTFAALADPTRRAILARLSEGEANVSELAEPFLDEMTLPAVTKHLKVLEDAGLVTKGRKSGNKHLFPLFYGTAGNGYFIVASKGGAPDHPGWYKNILANPEVELQVGTKTLKAKARTVSGAERAKLWDDAVKWWPSYTDYQKKTEREIPVVVLDPV